MIVNLIRMNRISIIPCNINTIGSHKTLEFGT